jgi:hypothetical protein
VLRRLLLLPLLAPLLAVLLVGALNPRPWVSLRLLTWSSAPLPLGAWMALAGVGGGALSAGATSLALRQGATPLRRQVRRRIGMESPEPWEEREEAFEPLERRGRRRESPPADWAADWGSAGGSRAPGQPAPTVSVPFRVIRRGEAAPSQAPSPAAAASGWRQSVPREPERVPEPVPAGEDWGTLASDDW